MDMTVWFTHSTCRVDYIETTPHVSRLHHLRIVSFMAILLVSMPYHYPCLCVARPAENRAASAWLFGSSKATVQVQTAADLRHRGSLGVQSVLIAPTQLK